MGGVLGFEVGGVLELVSSAGLEWYEDGGFFESENFA